MKQAVIRVDHEGGEVFDIDVRVYKNPKALRRAAKLWDRGEEESWTGTLAVCHCFETFSPANDYETRDPMVAIIRLQEENIGVGIISHEATHAAIWINDLLEAPAPTNGTDEDHAWLVGEITRQLCNTIDAMEL